MSAKLRAWWFHKQGLDGSFGGLAAREILSRSGWARSVGGSGPYLTLFARGGISRESADSAAASLEIHELPSGRGCTYVLPADDFALGLSVAQGFGDAAEMAGAKKFLGVTDSEIEALETGVIAALAAGPLDPTGLKSVLGDLVRNLGDSGKKRGMANTLPLALGRLQAAGRIRRIPANGRLDQQKYSYTLWENSPLDKGPIAREDAFVELARRYFRWTGPASVASFQWFSGLGVKASKDVIEAIGVVPIEAGSELLLFPDELAQLKAFEAPSKPIFALVSSIDGISLLRRDYLSLIDPDDRNKLIDNKGMLVTGGISEMSCNMILDRGRVVGLWEFDPSEGRIIYATFDQPPAGLHDAVQSTEAFIRDQLGDARSFSLDSPQSRKPRLDALRNPPWLD